MSEQLLRDIFAASALHALMNDPVCANDNPGEICRAAYVFADLMMLARTERDWKVER